MSGMTERYSSGFSLVELMLGITILGIICAACLPFYRESYNKTEITVIEKEIEGIVQYVRNRALLTGTNLTLNPLAGDWSRGMLLFPDNKTHHLSSGDHLLFQWPWHFNKHIQVKWLGFQSKDFLVFSGNIRQASSNGHFVILHRRVEVGRVVVNRIGRVL